MHELSIAQSIVDIIGQYVQPDQMPFVRLVRVKIGPLAGVVADSLEFCFGAIVGETPLSGAGLDIEETSIHCHCVGCSANFKIEGAAFVCPGCGSAEIKILSGTELQVVDIELADQQVEST